MPQTRGRCHNKKAGIRAAVILIGLLHKSRKAKEKEREREESEGWVSSSQVGGTVPGAKQTVCSAVLNLDCRENFTSLLFQRQEGGGGSLGSSCFSKFASGWSELVSEYILSECASR